MIGFILNKWEIYQQSDSNYSNIEIIQVKEVKKIYFVFQIELNICERFFPKNPDFIHMPVS